MQKCKYATLQNTSINQSKTVWNYTMFIYTERLQFKLPNANELSRSLGRGCDTSFQSFKSIIT